MNAPPSGMVTYLFTDIEGSTLLWDRYPEAMSLAQAAHDRILHGAVASGGGYVFSSAGDGIGASFESPQAALEVAAAVQTALGGHQWPEPIETIKVRMGAHIGEAVERSGDYFGTAVNRAARVAALANGGQVLVTDTVRLLVADAAPTLWQFLDLGEHRLRDLTRPERLYQFDTGTKQRSFPPLRPSGRTGNLAPRRSSLIGRDDDIAALETTLATERLITLTGVGGVGKTRLAVALGERVAARYPDGVWFVGLAPLRDETGVPAAVATALDVKQGPETTALARVVDAMSRAKMLVILDNAEHLVAAVASFADDVLSGTAGVDLVVTSRERLRVEGETTFAVEPLGAADDHASAVALFIERASVAAPDLEFDDHDRHVIAKICRQLDGLPLAIELAAAHCDTYRPGEILEGLGATIALESVDRSVADRHRTLRDATRWSYDLLEPADRIVFDHLSVFVGGTSLEAAAAVCGGDEADQTRVASSLQALVRASMATIDRRERATRFGQLSTLRSFAGERLHERGDSELLNQRHGEWFGALSANAAVSLNTASESTVIASLLIEWDNLRAAIHWAMDSGSHHTLAKLGAPLGSVIGATMRPEVLEWSLQALDVLPAGHPARAVFAAPAAFGRMIQGDWRGAVETLAAETQGLPDRDPARLAYREMEATVAWFNGDLDLVLDASPAIVDDAIDLRLGTVAGRVGADLALALAFLNRDTEAAAVVDRLARFAAELQQPSAMAWAKYARGEMLADSHPDLAFEELEEAIELALTVDSEFIAGVSLAALAAAEGRHGDPSRALDSMTRCIGFWERAGNRPLMWTTVRNLVELLDRLGRAEQALTLHAAVEADAAHAPDVFGPHGDRYRRIVDSIIQELDPHRADAALLRGGRLDFAGAVVASQAAIAEAQMRLT